MKKTLVTAAVAVSALAVIAAAKSDPVLMTVNKRPVHRSEFEYLYHKNNAQQLQPQSLDEYVDMFVNYKLKVADAEAAGLDTTKAFVDEYNQFRYELAEPYLEETAVIDSLVDVAYSHQKDLLYVRHIMLPLEYTGADMNAAMAKADSLRTVILEGKTTWDEAAARHSVDGGSRNNGGIMGWMPQNRYPWPFEEMAYNTKVGEISPAVNSGYGVHLIRIDSMRPNPGEVSASHILLLTQGLDSVAASKVPAKIDSIAAEIAAGADFADMAKRFSQDPGSAAKGGELGWFGPGMMVKPFEEAAFSLKDGEVSAPVQTRFGYHLIKKTGSRGVASLDDMRKMLVGQIKGDDRSLIARNKKLSRLTAQFNARSEEKGYDKVRQLIGEKYDSLAIERLKKSDIVLFRIGKTPGLMKEVMEHMPVTAVTDPDAILGTIRRYAQHMMELRLLDLERENLAEINPEYRNLINEYRDGILLFTRATEKVWDVPAKDPAALEAFFNEHRGEYKWDQPKFKGFIIMAKNDSILQQAKAYTDSVGSSSIDHAEFVKDMRKRFGRDIKVERVIAANGDNPITDYLAFGAAKPEPNNGGWNFYYAFRGHIIDAPEEAADVRGAVTTDFQNALEQAWVKELRKKYPVKIDKKVLQTVK